MCETEHHCYRHFLPDGTSIVEAVAEADARFDDFMREVAEALLGPPEAGFTWGGGAIMDGIRDLKRERDAALAMQMPRPPFVCTGSNETPADYRPGEKFPTGACGICGQRVAVVNAPLRTFTVTHPYKP